MSVSDLQNLNASFPISLRPSLKITDDNTSDYSKALLPILVIHDGILISVIEENLNFSSGIVFNRAIETSLVSGISVSAMFILL